MPFSPFIDPSFVDDLPSASDILSGTLTELPQKHKGNIVVAYALAQTLLFELSERLALVKQHEDSSQWDSDASNFITFVFHNFSSEMCVMTMRSAMLVHRLPLAPPGHGRVPW